MATVLQKSADYEPGGHLYPAGFEQYVTFHTFQPPIELQPFIDHFWILSWNRGSQPPYLSEQVMPRPYVDIFITRDESGVQCTFRGKKIYEAADEGRIVGARFRPGAFHAFWHGSLAGLHDKNLSLREVFPALSNDFASIVITLPDDDAITALGELLKSKQPQPDPHIALVNNIIKAVEEEKMQTVKAVAKRFAKSERWLQQLFQEYVGMGIKWLLLRRKLLQAAQLIREHDNPDWAAIAHDLDYSSQQHFITDFKRVLGKTPLQYKKALEQSK